MDTITCGGMGSQRYDLKRISLRCQRLALSALDTGPWRWHKDILNDKSSMTCWTTPAPDDQGRPHVRGKTDRDYAPATIELWKSDGRDFAPYHYQDKNLLTHVQKNGSKYTLGHD